MGFVGDNLKKATKFLLVVTMLGGAFAFIATDISALNAEYAEPTPLYIVESDTEVTYDERPEPETVQPVAFADWWRVRQSEQYLAVIEGTRIMIQAWDDANFTPPARVEFSFVGTLDAVVEWEYARGRTIATGTTMRVNGVQYSIEWMLNDSFVNLIVLDLYDVNDNHTSSVYGFSQMTLDPATESWNPTVDPNIHSIYFVGTHIDAWRLLGDDVICKPTDLWPLITHTLGSELSILPITHPPEWNMDAVVYAEVVTEGTFSELMDFWGYAETELDELLLNSHRGTACCCVVSTFIDDSFYSRIFTIIEFRDENHNLVGRYLLESFGSWDGERNHSQLPGNIRYFRTYDEFLEWKESQ